MIRTAQDPLHGTVENVTTRSRPQRARSRQLRSPARGARTCPKLLHLVTPLLRVTSTIPYPRLPPLSATIASPTLPPRPLRLQDIRQDIHRRPFTHFLRLPRINHRTLAASSRVLGGAGATWETLASKRSKLLVEIALSRSATIQRNTCLFLRITDWFRSTYYGPDGRTPTCYTPPFICFYHLCQTYVAIYSS